MKCLVFLLPIFLTTFTNAYEGRDLRCVVCQSTVKLMVAEISKQSASRKIDIGGYGLDKDGNIKKKTKVLIQSELFLSEVMENVCGKMDNYARANLKTNKKFVLVNLSDMDSRPSMNEVDFIIDGDLNKSVEHVCKGLLDEFEDVVLETFGKSSESPVREICQEKTQLCDELVEDFYPEKDEL